MRLLAIWKDQKKSFKIAKKYIVTSHTHNEILKQKNFTGSGIE